MYEITADQVMDILALGRKFPPVSMADISTHQSGSIYIDITSVVDAEVEDILSVLSEIFPSIRGDGNTSVHNRCDGQESVLYRFKTMENGLSISLHMIRRTEKPSAPTESNEEILQPKSIIDNLKVEPLVDRVWAEEILRSVENA